MAPVWSRMPAASVWARDARGAAALPSTPAMGSVLKTPRVFGNGHDTVEMFWCVGGTVACSKRRGRGSSVFGASSAHYQLSKPLAPRASAPHLWSGISSSDIAGLSGLILANLLAEH